MFETSYMTLNGTDKNPAIYCNVFVLFFQDVLAKSLTIIISEPLIVCLNAMQVIDQYQYQRMYFKCHF